MKTKHTLRKWTILEAGNFVVTPIERCLVVDPGSDALIIVGKVSGPMFTEAGQHQKYKAEYVQEVRHNARLIASAPELLEALKAFESATQSGNLEATRQAGILARAAIAKAEGL